ncbi:MAG: GGDEF domain-containing protein [Lachnospiraceae bacterium]|nr:GGDEF domain-containing protein [Lachnospiraceae bacterium]MCI9152007.1 GGDEF domain-containing protein [Lachnospiraceae bacterium]
MKDKKKNGIHLRWLCIVTCVIAGILVIFGVVSSQMAASKYQSTAQGLREQMWLHCFVLLALLALVVTVAVVLYRQVICVLKDYQDNITRQKNLEEQGVYELRMLARVRNASLEAARERERHLKSKADHDVLTGLLNRGGFEFLFKEAVHSGRRGAFMIIDADNFKSINDTYGHETGDKALKYVADVLRESFRSGDLIGRYGGDEFMTWMPGIDESHMEYLGNRVRDINRRLATPVEGVPALSVSVGILIKPGGQRIDFSEIFRKADKALYYVKGHGSQGCCIYDRNEVIR